MLQLALIIAVSYLVTGCGLVLRSGDLQPPAQWPPERSADMKSISLAITGLTTFDEASVPRQGRCQLCSDRVTGPIDLARLQVMQKFTQQAYVDSALFTQITQKEYVVSHGAVRHGDLSRKLDTHANIEIHQESRHPVRWLHVLTLGVIPRRDDYTVTMTTVFRDPSGVAIGTITKSESYSWWYHPFLLVVLPFFDRDRVVVQQVYYDLSRATLDEARAKGFL